MPRLHKFYVAPTGVAERAGIVVAEAAPRESVFRHAVPLFAGDLAGFAADAQRGVGEKRRDAHAGCSCARFSCSSASGPWARRPGRRLHSSALLSMIRTLGSSLMASRSFTMSPCALP